MKKTKIGNNITTELQQTWFSNSVVLLTSSYTLITIYRPSTEEFTKLKTLCAVSYSILEHPELRRSSQLCFSRTSNHLIQQPNIMGFIQDVHKSHHNVHIPATITLAKDFLFIDYTFFCKLHTATNQ